MTALDFGCGTGLLSLALQPVLHRVIGIDSSSGMLEKMASRRVRVDSLFLDEGFGTLDEDTLETALATLASLRQDGKLIGVISHVAALKERITTKILVEKISGGKSILYGPGCSRIN